MTRAANASVHSGLLRRALPALTSLAGLFSGLVLASHHPTWPGAALIAFLVGSAVVASRPGIWIFIVPAALPALNFSPWTGWVVFEEFDLLLLGVTAGAYARLAFEPEAKCDAPASMPRHRKAVLGLATAFALLGVTALVRGVAAADDASFGWFQGYADPLNGWRVFKSLLHAGLVWPLLRREIGRDAAGAVQRLASGLLVGLVVVTLAVVWERAAYPGLWDFSSRYRTTALFWEMHVGGAAIDAYLALVTPFVAWALWSSRTPLRFAAAAALALLAGYVCLTTFSRGVYAAVAGPLVLLGLLLASQRRGGAMRAAVLRALRIAGTVLGTTASLTLAFDVSGYVGAGLLLLALGAVLLVLQRRTPSMPWRPVAALALALALALEAVAVLGLGSFMRQRLAASDQDLGSRRVHWRNGVGLMQGPDDWLWGIGLGRLPLSYARAVPRQEFPGDVRLVPPRPGANSGSVSVFGPKTWWQPNGLLALTQRVRLASGVPNRVEFDVRATANTDVYLRLCEVHLLYARNCQAARVRIRSAPANAGWAHVAVPLRGPLLDAGDPWMPRLGAFSIAVVNAGGMAEFDNLSLVGPDRAEALANRDFSRGLAGWLPVAHGHYVPWHIDNLYLELLIERGALACQAFALCIGLALSRLVGAAGRTTPIAPFLAASLCGGLCVGIVSSVMDVPRVAFLLLLLLILAVELTGSEAGAGSPNAGGVSS